MEAPVDFYADPEKYDPYKAFDGTEENPFFSEEAQEDPLFFSDAEIAQEVDPDEKRLRTLVSMPDYPLPRTSQENWYGADTAVFLPQSYDARNSGLLTPVKDQGDYGTCWAFSTCSALETSLLKQGKGKYDFSEEHLAYFLSHRVNDPLGNSQGDKNILLKNSYREGGGNPITTGLFLSTWSGLADEALAPYPGSGNPPTPCKEEMAYQTSGYLQDCIFPSHYSVDFYKELIYTYGSLAVCIKMDTKKYMNKTTYALSVPNSSEQSDHMVVLVGWDDSYSKSNFLNASQVKQDGAFLVRNSWGSSWGKDGYFYLSYEDKVLGKGFGMALTGNSEVKYPNNYFYDGSSSPGMIYLMPQGHCSSFANVFQAKATQGTCEALGEVVLSDYSDASHYGIQVYTNLTDLSDPTSGIPAFSQPVPYEKPYSGVGTFTLPSEVVVLPGSYYSVVITNRGSSEIVYLQDTDADWDWISFKSNIHSNESFYYDGRGWEDLSGSGICARIKAHTRSLDITPSLSLSTNGMALLPGESKPVTATVEGISRYELSFTSSQPEVATVDMNGLVTGVAPGTTRITCRMKGAGLSMEASDTVTVQGSDTPDTPTPTPTHTPGPTQPGGERNPYVPSVDSTGDGFRITGLEEPLACPEGKELSFTATGASAETKYGQQLMVGDGKWSPAYWIFNDTQRKLGNTGDSALTSYTFRFRFSPGIYSERTYPIKVYFRLYTWSGTGWISSGTEKPVETYLHVASITPTPTSPPQRSSYVPEVDSEEDGYKVSGFEKPVAFPEGVMVPFQATGASAENKYGDILVKGDGKWSPFYWSTDEDQEKLGLPAEEDMDKAFTTRSWGMVVQGGLYNASPSYQLHIYYKLFTWSGQDWVATQTLKSVTVSFEVQSITPTPTATPERVPYVPAVDSSADGYLVGGLEEPLEFPEGKVVSFDVTGASAEEKYGTDLMVGDGRWIPFDWTIGDVGGEESYPGGENANALSRKQTFKMVSRGGIYHYAPSYRLNLFFKLFTWSGYGWEATDTIQYVATSFAVKLITPTPTPSPERLAYIPSASDSEDGYRISGLEEPIEFVEGVVHYFDVTGASAENRYGEALVKGDGKWSPYYWSLNDDHDQNGLPSDPQSPYTSRTWGMRSSEGIYYASYQYKLHVTFRLFTWSGAEWEPTDIYEETVSEFQVKHITPTPDPSVGRTPYIPEVGSLEDGFKVSGLEQPIQLVAGIPVYFHVTGASAEEKYGRDLVKGDGAWIPCGWTRGALLEGVPQLQQKGSPNRTATFSLESRNGTYYSRLVYELTLHFKLYLWNGEEWELTDRTGNAYTTYTVQHITPTPPWESPTPTPRPIELSAKRLTLYANADKEYRQNTLSVLNNSGYKVTFKSSNRKVATVSSKGKINAVSPGEATITVSIPRINACGYCSVKVLSPTLSVPSALVVNLKKTRQIDVSCYPPGKVTFSSSRKAVATVSKSGMVRGVRKGTSFITVTCNKVKKKVKVTVK